MRLRYTGTIPVNFMQLGLEVQPGDEFDVPFDDAEAYLSRADVEVQSPVTEIPADEPAPAKAKKTQATPETPAAQAPDEVPGPTGSGNG